MANFPDIPGADYIDAWYGSWPDFVGAEVIALYLNPHGKSWLQVFIERPAAISDSSSGDTPGGIITFSLMKVIDLSLSGLSARNRLGSLTVTRQENASAWQLDFSGTNGVSGWLKARELSVDLSPDEADPNETA